MDFQVDSSCLTIDKVKPEFYPNSAPLYIPMSFVNNTARYISIQAHPTTILTMVAPPLYAFEN